MVPELSDQIRVMSIITGVKAKFGSKSKEEAYSPMKMEMLEKIL